MCVCVCVRGGGGAGTHPELLRGAELHRSVLLGLVAPLEGDAQVAAQPVLELVEAALLLHDPLEHLDVGLVELGAAGQNAAVAPRRATGQAAALEQHAAVAELVEPVRRGHAGQPAPDDDEVRLGRHGRRRPGGGGVGARILKPEGWRGAGLEAGAVAGGGGRGGGDAGEPRGGRGALPLRHLTSHCHATPPAVFRWLRRGGRKSSIRLPPPEIRMRPQQNKICLLLMANQHRLPRPEGGWRPRSAARCTA